MAGKIKLVAKERFFYGGKNVEKDEEFEAEAQDVGLLTAAFRPMATQKGEDVAPLSTKDMAVETKPAPAAQGSGQATAKKSARAEAAARYSRRDMTAED